MKKPEYQTMVFSVSNSGSVENLWKDVSAFLKLINEQDYISVVRSEITNEVVVIEYEHNELIDGWGTDNPEWVTFKEKEMILAQRFEDDEEGENNE